MLRSGAVDPTMGSVSSCAWRNNQLLMKTRNHTLLSLAAFAGLALAATSATAEVITPVSATASSEYNATNGAAGNLLGPGFTALDPTRSNKGTHEVIKGQTFYREKC